MEEKTSLSAVKEAASAGIQSVENFLNFISNSSKEYESIADSVVHKFKVISLLDRSRTGHARFRRAPPGSPPFTANPSPISPPQIQFEQKTVSAFKVYSPVPQKNGLVNTKDSIFTTNLAVSDFTSPMMARVWVMWRQRWWHRRSTHTRSQMSQRLLVMGGEKVEEVENGVIAYSLLTPNEYTFIVVSDCANLARLKWGEQLHARVLCVGLLNSLLVANSIMTMYSKCGELGSVSKVFCTISFRDTITWSTIIAAYSQTGYGEEAFKYLSRMRSVGPKPNEFTLASVLSVCGNMAILEQGKQLHAHVLSVGLEQTSSVCRTLVIMCAKCGSITETSKIFNDSTKDDIISWMAMINGYAEHRESQEAIELFENIRKVGLRPHSVTFIGVLIACSHVGMVDLGFHYFNSMSKDYHITHSKEHYGCMIDFLCRIGQLTDAESLIRSMSFQPDDVVLSTLPRACRLHGDVDCGQRAAAEVLKLDPNCVGTHIILANIFAAKGKWREAASIRTLSKGVVKERGRSSIKVKDSAFPSVARDRLHPQGEDIYKMLEELALGMEIYILEFDHLVTNMQA